jgi:hypothetical protein
MNNLYRRFIEIITNQQFDFSELQGALIAVVWGLWLLLLEARPQQKS